MAIKTVVPPPGPDEIQATFNAEIDEDRPDEPVFSAHQTGPVGGSDFRMMSPAEKEFFMLDKLTVEVMRPTDPGSAMLNSINVACGAKRINVFFDFVQELPRWAVEILFRQRIGTVQTHVYENPQVGGHVDYVNRATVNTTPLAYPFRILRDPRGDLGRQWEAYMRGQE